MQKGPVESARASLVEILEYLAVGIPEQVSG